MAVKRGAKAAIVIYAGIRTTKALLLDKRPRRPLCALYMHRNLSTYYIGKRVITVYT